MVESTSADFSPGDLILAIPTGNQGLAEFFLAPASKAVRLPEHLSERESCILIQPLSTVLNAVDRLGDISGQDIVVVGLGSIGLLFTWLLRRRGAGRILGIDPDPYRCHLAYNYGVDQSIAARSIELVHTARVDPSAWQPPHICIEAVGHQPDTLNDCLELVRKQGTVLAFGVPDHQVYPIEFEVFFRKNLNLIAVVTPEWDLYLPKALELFLAHQDELEPLITHRLPICSAAEAYARYERREHGLIKAVLDASQWGDK